MGPPVLQRALRRPVVLVLLALSVVVAACARPSPAPAPAPSVVRAPLRAGTSGDYPPLSVWTGDRVEGFAPALVTAFARTEKRDVAWVRFGWPGLFADLQAGRFELAADGITVRPERSIGGRFSVPIARGGAVLLLRRPAWAPAGVRGVPLLAAIDRAALRVVVNRGGHLEKVARSVLPAADIRAIADNDAVRAAFVQGEADAAMTNTFEGPRWAAGAPGVEPIGPLTADVTAIWWRTDRAEMADRLDEWLLDEEESGRLAAVRAEWLGAGAGPRAASPVSALLAATAERLALMPFVAAAKERSGANVEDVAQEGRVIAASAGAVASAADRRGVSPPSRQAVESFFRAQIEAAKAVQQRTVSRPGSPGFSLDDQLRPAIARISARMAILAVRVPRGTSAEAVLAEARVDLASSGLEMQQIERLAAALAALGGGQIPAPR